MKELSNIIFHYKWCFAHICFNLIGKRTRTSYYHLRELHLTFNAIKNQLYPRQWKFYDKKISIWEMNNFTLKFKFWTGFERNCRGNYNWLSVKWIHHHHTADTLIFEAFLHHFDLQYGRGMKFNVDFYAAATFYMWTLS